MISIEMIKLCLEYARIKVSLLRSVDWKHEIRETVKLFKFASKRKVHKVEDHTLALDYTDQIDWHQPMKKKRRPF